MERNSREQSQRDIMRLHQLGMKKEEELYIDVYIKAYGEDSFIDEFRYMSYSLPKVALICINCSDTYKDMIIELFHNYECLELYSVEAEERVLEDVYEIVTTIKAEYVCFLLENHWLHSDYIYKMMNYLDEHEQLDAVLCFERLVAENDELVTDVDQTKRGIYEGCYYDGNLLLEYALQRGDDLWGSLSTILVRRNKFINTFIMQTGTVDEELQWLLFLCLMNKKIGGIEEVLVDTKVRLFNDSDLTERCTSLQKAIDWIIECIDIKVDRDVLCKLPSVYQRMIGQTKDRTKFVDIERMKKITFFYSDRGEFYNLLPLGEEAKRRGYEVKFTKNLTEKAEIGVYCQHVCFPENSQISMILLHDMAQGHNRWPDIWNIERWNKFDIGIVPGREWAERWKTCAGRAYANPRVGVFAAGYPKSDTVEHEWLKKRAKEVRETMNLKYKYSVLYAPSWENDGKEDDFICACQSLQVNLLIKQADWGDYDLPVQQNIEKMRLLHKGKYDNVYYLEPEENIMVAIELCDLIVSDESSVMLEGLLLEKPSIAVSDWTIPDTQPARLALFPFEFVWKCEKKCLRETVVKLLDKIEREDDLQLKVDFFANVGQSSKYILNILECVLGKIKETDCMQYEIFPRFMPDGIWSL